MAEALQAVIWCYVLTLVAPPIFLVAAEQALESCPNQPTRSSVAHSIDDDQQRK